MVRWNRAAPSLKMGMLQDDKDASGRGAFVRGEVMITPHDGGTHTVPVQLDCFLASLSQPFRVIGAAILPLLYATTRFPYSGL